MIRSIDSNQPNRKNNTHLMLSTATGAALGATARYIVPTKNEIGSLKTAGDTFFSSAATNARGANRSILKYAGIGAVIAAGISLIAKLVKNHQVQKQTDSFEYTKYEALLDTPGYAWEYVLYDK